MLKKQQVDVRFIGSGSPWQNGHNESFNSVFADRSQGRWSFYSIAEARCVVDAWLDAYNSVLPYGAINMITPQEFAMVHRQPLNQVA